MTHPALVPPLAIERYRILEQHLTDNISLADLARTDTVSERTLQRWLARYRSKGLAGLARISRADRGRLHLPDHLVALVRDLAIKRPRPPVAAIHRKLQELAVAEGHRAPSYSAVARVVRAIPASQIAAASDPAAYRDEHELVHRREAAASNEMWQADHTVLDILVLDDAGTPVRPWLTVVLDDHSRAIAGYFISLDAPSALNTALALRQAIWRKANPAWIVSGIPEQLYVDNGSDFISEHIEQACIALKIRLIHSLPGRPRGRGKIERVFRTINDMFLSDLPGHTIAGKSLSAPTLKLDELRTRFETFVCGVYHRRQHGSTGEPPVSRWQKGGFLPAMPDSLEHLRDMADRRGFGLILMGMPGLEKRLARYAQFYSRIGFVHEFKPLTETEMCLLLATHAGDFGITFDPAQLDAIEAQAAVIRITRGNFRLMERLFAQMRRIMTLNRVDAVSPDIVQAAQDCLVIGPGN